LDSAYFVLPLVEEVKNKTREFIGIFHVENEVLDTFLTGLTGFMGC